MVHWGDSFWSEGNRGFEVLSSNVKNGAIAIEEFQRFLNESVQCESTYCKSLSRLQSQFVKIQHVGTFTPIWNLIRDLLDKTSSTHLATVNLYQEVLRDIHNYQELYQKKVKSHIQKDGDILRSADLITQLHSALHTVNKAKEQYHAIAFDSERTKRVGSNPTNNSSTSTSQDNGSTSLAQSAINSITARQVERSERKYRQAQDDYKLTIEKYNVVRNEYEKRFYDACTKFQDFEIDHIEKMLVFALNYSNILQRTQDQLQSTNNEFNTKLKALTGHELLDTFVEQKKTGTDRPAVLQFEEIDNLKASTQLSNSAVNDLSTSQESSNLFDQSEPGVPSFQAHFSIPALNVKTNDNNRALSPTSGHSLTNNTATPPVSTKLSLNPMASVSSTVRSPDATSGNDQTSNPFDVKIRRPKFPVFFGSNRKDKKEKKVEKKPSITLKSGKNAQKQRPVDDSSGVYSHSSTHEANDFTLIADNNEDNITQNSPNTNKAKCPTPEPYTQSTSPFSNVDHHHHRQNAQSTIPFQSSKISKSSSSTDSSDDDDDNPMLKMKFKINERKSPAPNENGEGEADEHTKIINAMRLVDKNIGNPALTSRATPNKTREINKDQTGGKVPPPPPPPRLAATLSSTVMPNNLDHSNIFPAHDEFDRSSLNSKETTPTTFALPRPTAENVLTASISSADDDAEVANSFPNDNSPNKTTPFPLLQVSSSYPANQQLQPFLTSSSPSTNLNSNNEQMMSPLTIGANDQIPLAIAFQETIHVLMTGNNSDNWKSRIVGEMLISFPASMITLLTDPSRFANTLEFCLKQLNNIENIIEKSPSVSSNETSSSDALYSFDMTELNGILRNLQEKTPSSRFFNLNVLSYEVKNVEASTIPIQVSSQWTRTFDTISVNINYRFDSSALPESIRLNNDTVIIYTIITDGVQIKESSPTAGWSTNEHKLWWKVPYTTNGAGTLSGTVLTGEIDTVETDHDSQALTTSSTIHIYFVGENALFSSIDFDLVSRGYRISLLKKKILSGKYQSEPDPSEPIHFFQRPTIFPSPLT